MEIKVKLLPHAEGLSLPAYQSSGAAGFDLVAAVPSGAPICLAPGGRCLAPTGLILEIPDGFEGQVRPRSGVALKHGVTVLNAPGTVDSDFRGEVGVILVNHGAEAFEIVRGDRIAQFVIAPVARAKLKVVEETDETARGAGGFGSTGRS